MELTRFFKNLSKENVNLAGGKGASLGEMTQAGIPVPNGFVILSDSFEKFLESTDLNVELDSILERVNHKEMQSIENASEEIKALILLAKMPKDIETQIKKDFKELNAKYVAVRSSATSEDSSSAAWAGQLDSFLNTTEKDLLDKVKHCWASLFTPRAIFYRFEKGLHNTKISVAVVVQKMVNSEISGIAFSVHPVTQDRNQLIIEAGFGLGESIVSGQITPDSYVIEKSPRRIIDKNVNEQERGLFKIEGGGSEWKSTKEHGNEQKLSDKQIMELSEIILRIEKHYGFPCDIEWAFEEEKFFIVQSRPITTLTDKENDKEMPKAKEMKVKVEEKIDSKFKEIQKIVSSVPLDVKQAKCSILAVDLVFPTYAKKDVLGNCYSPLIIIYKDNNIQQIILENQMNGVEEKIWERAIKDKKKFIKILNEANALQKKIDNLSVPYSKLQNFSDEQLLKYFNKIVEPSLKWWGYAKIGGEKGLIVDKKIIPLLVKNHGLSPEEAKEYAADMTMPKGQSIFSKERINFLELCIKTLEDKKLCELIREKKEIPKTKYKKYLKEVNEYCKKYFYSRTNFYEAVQLNERTLPSVLLSEGENNSLQKLKEELLHIKNGEKELHIRQKVWAKKIKPTKEEKEYLWYFEIMHTWIDDRKASMVKHFYYLMQILQELSVRRKIPYSTIAVMHHSEIRKLIKGEKIDSEELNARYNGIVIVYEQGNLQTEFRGIEAKKIMDSINNHKETDFLKGTIAFKGNGKKINGKVRIVHDPAKDTFLEGEVLVTTMTRPEFVPIMKKAIAIITDEGGLTSHAAIVSRELGVPCIIGTKNASRILKDGMLVEVDAEKGIVKVINSLNNESNSGSRGVAEEIKKEFSTQTWTRWLERPFQAFTLSLFEDAYRKESFEELGFYGIDERPQLFQEGFWYLNDKQMQAMDAQVKNYLDKHGMKSITNSLEKFKNNSQKKIQYLIDSKLSPEEKFAQIFSILKNACTYIWLAHGLESFYSKKLNQEVPKYIKKDINKFIGDASFPKKKNSNAILEELMRSNTSSKEIAKKAGWVKIRDGFSDPFTTEEIDSMRKSIKPVQKHVAIKIPKQLKPLFDEMQELVFFRTERTDVFYKLYFQSRPVLQQLADKYKIPFKKMRYYRAKSFLSKKPEKYSPLCTMAFSNGKVLFQNEKLMDFEEIASVNEIRGTIAFKGKVKGIAKIIKDTNELNKVKEGDILVTQMTFPSFIPAMTRAIAFVTDEGGITCHAAIVAREMNKPCIIGTKNATKILKDGDLVEVDANNGTVKILSKDNGSIAQKNDFWQVNDEDSKDFLAKIKQKKWVPWLNRPYNVFWGTANWKGVNKEYFKKAGFGELSIDAYYYDHGTIYYPEEFLVNGKKYFEEYFKKNKMEKISKTLSELHKSNIQQLKKVSLDKNMSIQEKTFYFSELARSYVPFLWILLPLEHYFNNKIQIEVPRYVKGDYAKFVGDISVPKKKNAYTLMLDELKQGESVEEVQKKFGWIKSMDIFTEPYTREEIMEIKKSMVDKTPQNIKVPKELVDLSEELKELTFFRTDRTDKFANFFAEAKPIIKEIADHLGVKFEELADYDVNSIIIGAPKKYYPKFSYFSTENKYLIIKTQENETEENSEEIKGLSAFGGKVKGIAKIVRHPNEVNKVNQGDILVSQMTFPSFISAMYKASAFVTDEGSITCHAAIIARELKKPCIIGTKNATKILKDGDLVEVDANNGTVKVLNSSRVKQENSLPPKHWKDSFRWKYEAWPFFTSVYIKASVPQESKYYVTWNDYIKKFENGHAEEYIPKTELIQKGKKEIEELIKGDKKFADEFRDLHKRMKKAIKKCETALKEKKHKNKDYWWDGVEEGLSLAAALLFAFDYSLNDWMKEMQNKDPKTFSILFAAIKEKNPSFINEATVYLNNLVKKYPKDFDKICIQFNKRYGWFQNSYVGKFEITKEWLNNYYKQSKNENKKTTKSIVPPKKYKLLTELASEAITFRDDKKKLLLLGVELMEKWLKDECKQKGWDYDEMKWLTMEEIEEIQKGEFEFLEKAKKCSKENKRIGLMTQSGYSDISEEFFTQVQKEFLGNENLNEIHGMSANKGKVIGIARVILDAKKDAHKLQKGDILVTSMTRPEFLALMNKASAFVTDEGGITCHAAIVAREMNKPCIISTKTGTQRIHDGDLIEVDANNGVVKILERVKK